jgi:phosphoglycolate phosphatase
MRTPPDVIEADMIATDLYPGLLRAYEGRLAEETRLYDGVAGCLDALEAAGWRLGVCTNKPEYLAVLLLDRLGVLSRLGAVLGADTLTVRKPDPEHLLETARRSGARPDLCVMLGDTMTDLLTARAAGVPCVLTSFGFAVEPMDELTPDAVVGHFDEIAPVLERLCPPPAKTA